MGKPGADPNQCAESKSGLKRDNARAGRRGGQPEPQEKKNRARSERASETISAKKNFPPFATHHKVRLRRGGHERRVVGDAEVAPEPDDGDLVPALTLLLLRRGQSRQRLFGRRRRLPFVGDGHHRRWCCCRCSCRPSGAAAVGDHARRGLGRHPSPLSSRLGAGDSIRAPRQRERGQRRGSVMPIPQTL